MQAFLSFLVLGFNLASIVSILFVLATLVFTKIKRIGRVSPAIAQSQIGLLGLNWADRTNLTWVQIEFFPPTGAHFLVLPL